MVRMSDILKKAKERKEQKERISPESTQPETASQAPSPQAPKQEIPSPPQAEEKPTFTEERKEEASQIPEVRISPVVMKETKPASNEETKKLYLETISLMKELMKKNIDYEHIDNKKINTQIERIIDQLRLNNQELLRLALIKNPNGYDYPFCHLVNSCILSIVIGLALGYDKSKLMELGITAIFLDLGMINHLDLASQPRKLNIKEYNEIKNHVVESVAISKRFTRVYLT